MIRYFTALINVSSHDPNGQFRQKQYLRALATLPQVTIHRGHFLTHRVKMPLATRPPKGSPLVEVIKSEEKGSDVNLATYLVADGYEGLYDVAVVISNDSDLVEPIAIVRQRLRKVVGVINPNQIHPSAELKANSDFFRKLHPGLLSQSQFPAQLVDKKGSFGKPVTW